MGTVEAYEFTCKCGCGLNNVKPKTVEMFADARAIAKVPFVFNSGCRCRNHNAEIKGKPGSSHLSGWAGDISTVGSFMRFRVLKGLIMAGFTRIEIRETWIHGDIDPEKTGEVIWLDN